jgi:hypothetical protein
VKGAGLINRIMGLVSVEKGGDHPMPSTTSINFNKGGIHDRFYVIGLATRGKPNTQCNIFE